MAKASAVKKVDETVTGESVAPEQATAEAPAKPKTKTPTPIALVPDTITLVKPDLIEVSLAANRVRKFDPNGQDFEALKNAIADAGIELGLVGRIYEPVVLRRIDKGRFEVVTGAQRVRVAKLLNAAATPKTQMKVPAVLIEEEFNEGQSLARQSAENTRTNWTNADKATTAQRLTKYYDGSSEERPLKTSVDIARMLGVVPGLISQYLAIAKGLTKSEMQQLAAGELTLTQAVNLARIKDKAIKDAAKQKVAEAKRVAEGKAGADPKAAKAARKEASALIDKALEDAKGEDRAKRSEGGETFPGVKPKAATKKHLKSSRTNEEIIDDFVTEFGAKAHGELADEIARAFLRYISHGKIADFGEEVESMEEEMKLKLKAAAKKQAASE